MFTRPCASGVIRTSEILDREKMPHYWLAVLVTDLGTEPLLSRTHVYLEVLDINDNAPQLSQPVYFAAVPENVDRVGSVAQVAAADADASSEGKLSFHLLESHRAYFDVDPQTGSQGSHSVTSLIEEVLFCTTRSLLLTWGGGVEAAHLKIARSCFCLIPPVKLTFG